MKNKLKLLSIFLASAIFASACGTEAATLQTMSAERTEQFQEVIRNVAESMAEEETTDPAKEHLPETAEQEETVQPYIGSPHCTLDDNKSNFPDASKTTEAFDYSQIPEYSTKICIDVNEGQPYFTEKELQSGTSYYISLSELDNLGRCGSNIMALCSSDMPTEERGPIGNIKPTGWNQAKYDPALTESDSPFYQNRCHILCFAASGLNSEARNLITGTRAFNLAMLSYFEEPLLKYLEDHPNMHVLYRGTPIFVNDELMARGILMEAESVEDNGASLKMCKYIYNIQKNVNIDYATGKSTGPEFAGTSSEGQTSEGQASSAVSTTVNSGSVTYIANSSSMKFHTKDCENAAKISAHNKIEMTGTREEAIAEGYEPAGCCQP